MSLRARIKTVTPWRPCILTSKTRHRSGYTRGAAQGALDDVIVLPTLYFGPVLLCRAVWSVESRVHKPALSHTPPEPRLKKLPCITEGHKTVSLFKNQNAPKIERANACAAIILANICYLCVANAVSLEQCLWFQGKTDQASRFCSECVSSQEEIFGSLEFWMYEKRIFFFSKQRVHDKKSTRFLKEMKPVFYSCPFPLPRLIFFWILWGLSLEQRVSSALPFSNLRWQFFWPWKVGSGLAVAWVASLRKVSYRISHKLFSPGVKMCL